MFCPRCGKEFRNNQRFCINCGYDLTEDLRFENNKEKNSTRKKSYYKIPPQKKFDIHNIKFDILSGFLFKIFLTVVVILGLVSAIKIVVDNYPSNKLASDKAKYEHYITDASAIPELVQPESLQDLVRNLKDVQNFLVMYLKYSNDSIEDKRDIFENYRKQILKIETFSNDNLLKEDIKNSIPQTKQEFNSCAKYYNKVLAPVGLRIASDSTYGKYHLKEDFRFTYKKFGHLLSPDLKAYLYLRAKHNKDFLENGGYLGVAPNIINKCIADYEKYINDNKNFEYINEVKDYLFYYTYGYIFANDRQDMKVIKNKSFKKWDKKFIKQNKNSKLIPIYNKIITSANGMSSGQFENLYPYEYEENFASIRPENANIDDIFSGLRKDIIKGQSNTQYKFIYYQIEGMWYPYSDDMKITKDALILAEVDDGLYDVYNNKFKKMNQTLKIDSEYQMILKRGQMLLYNSRALQISKVDYTYNSFSIKVLPSKAIRQYFPDVLIINLDNIGSSPVQVTKTKEVQSYMLISHAGSNFENYVLHSDISLQDGELNNMFTINTVNTVNIEWIPENGDGKQYYITFVTKIPEAMIIQSEESKN